MRTVTSNFRSTRPLFRLGPAALVLILELPVSAQDATFSPRAGIDIGLDQRLGDSVMLDLPLRDEAGHPITLREAAAGKPMILALVYYRCPMLCTLELNGLVDSLRNVVPSAGEHFTVVAVSFDPSEGADLASAKRLHYLRAYGRPASQAGWRFLTGAQAPVSRLCQETGFRFRYNPSTLQFAHPSAIVILTREGRISRYFPGIVYPSEDLRLSLVEASSGQIGTVADRLLLLFCMQYDPTTGRYGIAIMRVLRSGALISVAALLVLVATLRRRSATPIPATSDRGSATVAERM